MREDGRGFAPVSSLRVRAQPISDDAPVMRTNSFAMHTYPDGCLRHQFAVSLADGSLDLDAMEGVAQEDDLALDGEALAGVTGELKSRSMP